MLALGVLCQFEVKSHSLECQCGLDAPAATEELEASVLVAFLAVSAPSAANSIQEFIAVTSGSS